MSTGKRWISGLLAVLLIINGFSAADMTPLGMQKVFADTVKQPSHSVTAPILPERQAKNQKTRALIPKKKALAVTSRDTSVKAAASKSANSKLLADTGSNAAATDPDSTIRAISAINQLNYSAKNMLSEEFAVANEQTTGAALSVPMNVNLQATAETLTASWDAVADAQSYDVSFDGDITNTIETSYTFSGLLPNTSHSAKIRAVTSEGSSEWSTEITRDTLLQAPSNFASDISGTSVNLTWNPVSGASGYEIYRDNIKIGTSEGSTYSDSELEIGTTYVYRIKAFYEMWNTSELSGALTVSIPAYTSLEPPVFSPVAGRYNKPQTVALSNNIAGAAIYYTIDGSDPTTGSAIYVSPISVTETTMIRAIAVKEGLAASDIASAEYIIQEDTATGTDGSVVDLSMWDYCIIDNSYYSLVSYKGGFSDGKITGTVPAEINGKPVKSMDSTFIGCAGLTHAPVIPDSVTDLKSTFRGCRSLTQAPVIPYGVVNMSCTFQGCTGLAQAPEIPNSVTNMSSTFSGCTGLTQAPVIPASVINMSSTFLRCSSLVQAPAIPESVTEMSNTFYKCTSLTGNIFIPKSVISLYSIFSGTSKPITMVYTPSHSAAEAYSAPDNVTKAADSAPPVISGVTGTTSSSIYINATDDYTISGYSVTGTAAAPANGWQKANTFSNMQNGTYYAWAIDEAGNVSVGLEFLYTGGKVTVPVNLVVTPSAISVDLAWDNVLGAAAYDIELDGQVVCDITQTTYAVTALIPGTQHFIRVRAKNASGTGSWSEQVNAYTLLNTPSNVKATATTTTLAVSWDAVNNAANYDIELNGSVVKSSDKNSCVVSGLTPATQYKIRIKAGNADTCSAWSSELSMTTLTSTNAGGTLSRDTTWTVANSPYILNGSLTIQSVVTLTVEPGVVVKSSNCSNVIDVQGKLVALGTTGSAIVFTTVKDAEYGGSGVSGWYQDYWAGINVAATGEFVGDHVKLRYGGANGYNNSCILSLFGKLTLTNSVIINSCNEGIRISSGNDVIIQNTIIDGSQGYNNLNINKNNVNTGTVTLKNNTIRNGLRNGITVSEAGASGLIIENNIIDNNTENGIYI